MEELLASGFRRMGSTGAAELTETLVRALAVGVGEYEAACATTSAVLDAVLEARLWDRLSLMLMPPETVVVMVAMLGRVLNDEVLGAKR